MKTIITAQRRLERKLLTTLAGRLGGRSDRGDVPGWVLITIMTAGLVTALWAIAGPQLSSLFSDAISSVKGP
ncbi:hypothetical protein FHX52_1768 [Humibacillus xanthopallidus]|uniref:Uncharacterized protein n=1 Tax=Humibacillus xanthopallidus TaxID=412689 RepID=A0A543PX38_9MICO|nr:hypothetical protein [Humibacillus xanthopallidus]TQN48626.1 hypothetical protein FHX52_1768 [Humibacillus xanthopallidus]